MRCHFVLGSKGGSGKTSVAVTIAASYLKHNQDVLLVDTNTNNIDFNDITSGFEYNEVFSKDVTAGDSRYIGYHFVNMHEETNSYNMIKDIPYKIFQGLDDFYNMLLAAKMFAEEMGIEIIIVDTNMSFVNMFPIFEDDFLNDPNREKKEKKSQEIESLIGKTLGCSEVNPVGYGIHFWMLWGYHDFVRIRHSSIDRQNIEALNKLKEILLKINPVKPSEKVYDDSLDMIHILNCSNLPYAEKTFYQIMSDRNITDKVNPKTGGISLDNVMLMISEFGTRDIQNITDPTYNLYHKNSNLLFIKNYKDHLYIDEKLRNSRSSIDEARDISMHPFLGTLDDSDNLFMYKKILKLIKRVDKNLMLKE